MVPSRLLPTFPRFAAMAALALSLIIAGACHHHDSEHSHTDEHSHADVPSHADGHEHSEGEAWAMTAWGEVFEIFAEADPLQTGETSRSHTHVTWLEGHLPLTEGRVAAILRDASGEKWVFEQDAALRNGIFDVQIVAPAAGEYELAFRVAAGEAMEEIPVGLARIGDDSSRGTLETPDMPGSGAGEPISFLKEEQWRLGAAGSFAIAPVETGEIAEAIEALGTVRTRAGGEIVLTAPADAVVMADAAGWPYPGRPIRTGETVFRLALRFEDEHSLAELEADIRVLETELEVARAQARRLEQLFAVEAVSRRATEEAAAEVEALEAQLAAARVDAETVRAARHGSGGESGEVVTVSAPLSGEIAAVDVSPGQAVEAGDRLGRLVAIDPLWIELRLRQSDAAPLDGEPAGLELSLAGGKTISFAAGEVRLISLHPEVDPTTGTIGVLLEIPGRDRSLRPGSAVEADLLLPAKRRGITVPAAALIDDGGVDVVYVMLDGESFARREVRILARQGERLLVDGLMSGEWLVIRGGDAIRRSTLITSGGGHGHVH